MTGTSARQRERAYKTINVTELKGLDAALGLFEGYLSVFGNLDENGDVVERGAFKRTLNDAMELKRRNGSKFLYPLLWMHDEGNPVGGFMEMAEDNKGLYVKGMCDLDTEMGRRAFSGMQKGYMGQLSIGYRTVKSTRDSKGARHLLEIQLFEGSVITTNYAANGEALIVNTKGKQGDGRAAKTASGKSSWPLAERDHAWDAGAAHNRLVAWATNDDGSLDESKMKSVHFYYDEAAPDKITSYKLAFCDVIGDEVKAIPRAVFACAGSHGVNAASIPSGDKTAIKTKIAAYYRRIAKENDDDSIVAPWEEQKIAWKRAVQRKAWGGLMTLTRSLSAIDGLVCDVDTLLEMLGDAVGMNLDPDDGDVGAQVSGVEKAGVEVEPAVQLLVDGLPGLGDALTTLATTFEAFEDAKTDVLGMLGIPGCEDGYGYMGTHPILELKAGKTISATTKKKIMAVHDQLGSAQVALKALVQEDQDEDQTDSPEPKSTDRAQEIKSKGQPGAPSDTTASDAEPDLTDTTLLAGLEEMVLESQLQIEVLKS